MKILIVLFLSLVMPVAASGLSRQEAILKMLQTAHDVNSKNNCWVDYQRVMKSDKTLTKEKVQELSQSIDPEKVRFAAYVSKSGYIEMIEPKNIRFTMESRAFSDRDNPTSIASYFVVVGIQLKSN